MSKLPAAAVPTIQMIADRAHDISADVRPLDAFVCIAAVHAVTPLDLDRMLSGTDEDLMHDVLGIAEHIDWATGELRDCFAPRFTKPEARP